VVAKGGGESKNVKPSKKGGKGKRADIAGSTVKVSLFCWDRRVGRGGQGGVIQSDGSERGKK